MSSNASSLYRLYLKNRAAGQSPLYAYVNAQITKDRAAKVQALRHSFAH